MSTAAEALQPNVAVQAAPQHTLYHSPEAERFVMEQRMAKIFVESGLFGDVKGQTEKQAMAQAYVKIALGGSMGFSAAESMQGIDIIQGRPAVSAQLRAARMQRAGFTWAPTATNKGCWLAMYFQGRPIMVPRVDPATGQIARDKEGNPLVEHAVASYTEEDATKAKLIGKDNWLKDPSSMYFARAVTRAQRRFAPGVLSGDIMTQEEVYDAEPGSFSVVEAEPLKEPQQIVEKAHAAEAVPEQVKVDKGRQEWVDRFSRLEANLGTEEFMRRLGAGPESYGALEEVLSNKLPALYARMEKGL